MQLMLVFVFVVVLRCAHCASGWISRDLAPSRGSTISACLVDTSSCFFSIDHSVFPLVFARRSLISFIANGRCQPALASNDTCRQRSAATHRNHDASFYSLFFCLERIMFPWLLSTFLVDKTRQHSALNGTVVALTSTAQKKEPRWRRVWRGKDHSGDWRGTDGRC